MTTGLDASCFVEVLMELREVFMSKINKNIVVICIAIVCIGISLNMLITGNFKGIFLGNGYKQMLIQLFIWFFLALVGLKKRNILWPGMLLIVFCYLHMMLLPMLAACVYAVLTVLVGRFINHYILKYRDEEQLVLEYFVGMMILTICYAVLSVLQIGSILNIRIFCAVLFLFLFIWQIRMQEYNKDFIRSKCLVSSNMYMKLVMIMLFLMITIGRANISLDYDSMWYGLRASFVLDNTTGIYENLKLVGCVYTYPKGYEIYQLPLASSKSYGFMYAGNILMFMALLYVVYRICRKFLNRESAMWGVVLVAAIPGISNMSITAKPDIMTLLIQLISILFGILFVKKQQGICMGVVIATYVYAQTLKPTSIVFSTSILILVLFICFAYRIRFRFGKTSWILLFITLIDLVFIWARTYIMTGIPATSVWGTIFRALGMQDKYPFASGQISQFRTEGLFSKEVIIATIQRMKEFFFAPNSADTDHIILAWGTVLCTFIVAVILFITVCNMKHLIAKLKEDALTGFLLLLFWGELMGCIMSLWLLTKPDGNYFMLYYCSTVIVGVIFVDKMLIEDMNCSREIISGILGCFVLINISMTGMTNWAWTNHFCEINWINRGFYNHQLEYKTELKKSGCKKIYEIVTESLQNRVLAFAVHPQIERIPCVIESDLDVNYWGNQELMVNQENFLTFIDYIDYDYIMIWNDYVQDETIPFYNISSLFDTNKVEDLVIENGHMLLKMGNNVNEEKSSEMKIAFEKTIREIE